MDGILIIDKPAGITSHDVVNRVRRILQTRRVGHTGTLDPFATGVMVVVVGKATRLAQFLDKDEKEYEAVVRFGFETETGDRTGGPKPQVQSPKSVLQSDLEKILPSFLGEIEQIPPMFSAKKVAGKKLYEHARKGVEIERKPVRVIISTLEIIESAFRIPHSEFRIRVVCSAGTYIRTLAEDIGRVVGTGAHLAELRRTRAGRFNLSQSVTLDELEQLAEPTSALLPKEIAVGHLPSIILDATRVEKTKSGLSTRVNEAQFADNEAVSMLDEKQNLIAIGFYDAGEKSIRPKIVLV